MTSLSAAKKPSTKSPLIMTIYGPAGSGKTSMACTFPNAFMIRTQGEQLPRDIPEDQLPDCLDPIGSKTKDNNGKNVWDEKELFDQLMALLREEHDYKTLIIDSVTGLEDLFIKSVVENDPKNPKSIVQAQGGYGAGRASVRAKHSRVRSAAELLRDRKGMTVVFLAHVEVDKIDLPDTDPYSSYSLQLHKESAPIYINSCDVVAFMKQEVFVTGDEDGPKKARTSGNRVLSIDLTPSNVSKNRLGIQGDIQIVKGENPFQEYI